MRSIDWRRLYADNQAAIAAAGVPVRALNTASAPARHFMTPRDANAERGALVHVPPGLDPAVPAPMVCMLHGCTQDPATFAAATAMNETADRHGFVAVYPSQSRARNAQGCWNWFLPGHQRRGAGEPELIAAVARELASHDGDQAIDPTRVFIAGLSSGGAMALIVAACYPDVFAAAAIHSGLPYRAAGDVTSAFAVMARGGTSATDGQAIHKAMGDHARPLPTLVIHGTADRTVAPDNAERLLAQSMHANRLAAPQSCDHHPATPTTSRQARAAGGLAYTESRWCNADGALMHELIRVDGLGHAWSGGVPDGSYTDPRGPSASEAIWAFFARTGRPPAQPRAHAGAS